MVSIHSVVILWFSYRRERLIFVRHRSFKFKRTEGNDEATLETEEGQSQGVGGPSTHHAVHADAQSGRLPMNTLSRLKQGLGPPRERKQNQCFTPLSRRSNKAFFNFSSMQFQA
jgi:hypothetical protein